MALNRAGKADGKWLCRELQRSHRDALLNESLLFDLDNARRAIAEWAEDYNHFPTHSSLGYQTQTDYAGSIAATGVSRTAEALIADG